MEARIMLEYLLLILCILFISVSVNVICKPYASRIFANNKLSHIPLVRIIYETGNQIHEIR